MNYPCLYQNANNVQRHDAEEIIKEYSHKLQWRLDGGDTLLDVGSGCGDVLMDFVYKIMPDKFLKLVGSDISDKMMSYAKNLYASYEKCDFKVLDIACENNLPIDMKEQFDHITSFYCLHWIVNKRQAMQNIFNLLRAKSGDCLLVFLAAHPIFDAYREMGKLKKWSSYIRDVEEYVIPLDYICDPREEISQILRDVGFSDIQVEVKQKVYTYESLDSFKDNFKAVNPFLDRMTIPLQENFMDELVDTVTSFGVRENHPTRESDFIFRLPYKLVVVYAKKFPNKLNS